MKHLLKLKLCFVACLFFNYANATNWVTIFEAGFEANEDLSAWELQHVLNETGIFPDVYYRDYFFVGSAVAFEGERSLYVSEDGGNTNLVTSNLIGANPSWQTAATLSLPQLAAGNYSLSFMYQRPHAGQSIILALVEDISDENTDGVFFQNFETSTEWRFFEESFTIPEGGSLNYFYVDFLFIAGGNFNMPAVTTNGFAIDNIVIRKEDTSTSTPQPSASDKSISVFPNPAQDVVNIVLPESTPSEVSIFSLSGALLKTVQAVGAEVELSVESLPSGSYIVVVQQGENRYTQQVIVTTK